MRSSAAVRGPQDSALVQLTARLRQATATRDVRTIRAIYQATFGGGLRPRQVSGARGPERDQAVAWFEAWDDTLQRLAFGPDGDPSLRQAILFPARGGFPMGLLLLNAMWLRRSGSARAGTPPPLPPDFAALDVASQSAVLGRTLVRTDAHCAFDYGAVADAVHPALVPGLLLWLLGGYLIEPLATMDEAVEANRQRAIDGFVAHHRDRAIALPPQLVYGVASFAATAFAREPRAFLETLCERLLAPTLRKVTGAAKRGRRRRGAALDQAVMLTCWKENSAVFRCMNPVVGGMLRSGTWGIQLGASDRPAPELLPAEWRGVQLRAWPASSMQGLAAAANGIRALRLDFLMYPEVGISSTRWLATQRVARVQAAGYGHPITTGSSAIDYFVGGARVELDAEGYGERLVLLPGLGVSSEAPPLPTRPRQRPVGGRETLLVSFASYNKLNRGLLRTWNAALGAAGPDTALHWAPGLSVVDSQALLDELGPHLNAGRVVLLPRIPRPRCIDLLWDADVYLDSFPFGGFNTVVEALASGCPVVTLEGRRAQGRFAAATLRLVGLPEWLIAQTPEDYVAAVRRLVREPSLRAELRAMLTREHVLRALARDEMAAHFDAAVAWMRQQGPGTSGPPMLIEAGESPRVWTGATR